MPWNHSMISKISDWDRRAPFHAFLGWCAAQTYDRSVYKQICVRYYAEKCDLSYYSPLRIICRILSKKGPTFGVLSPGSFF